MAEVPEVIQTGETAQVQIPAPKKRGRKRKSEIPIQIDEEIVLAVPKEETISRRGRPRKKVNYYELANPENLDFSTQSDKEIEDYLRNEETNNKIKVENNSNSPNVVTKNKLAGTDSLELIDDSNVANGNHEDLVVSNGTETISKDANVSFEDATTSTPNAKDKRYNYTGETVKMMNTLFTLFNTDEKAQDSTNNVDGSNSSNVSVVANSSNNGKRPYRKSKKHNVTENDVDDGSGNVTCAVCNTTLDKSLWSHHKQRYHNNLSWRVGDPPLDLNDQSFVMHTLNMLYKKKKPLYCDKCGEVKKSVVGFLSHRSQCLKSEEQLESVKIACELCGRKMLPVSMSTHMKMLHQNPTEKQKDTSLGTVNELNKPLPSKRSAARKAMKIIETVTKSDDKEKFFTTNLDLGSQEFAREIMQKELDETQFIECRFRCNCITTSMEDAVKHLEECTDKPTEGFVCKQCLVIATTLEEIIYHVEFNHEVSVDKGKDDDDNDIGYIEKESGRLPSFLHNDGRKADRALFSQAFDWTYNFCEENFSDQLFDDLPFNKTNWFLLSSNQASKYLPKMNESCHVARTRVTAFINPLKDDHTFKKYNLFESDIHDNKITLFCGGPISSLAWLPIPHVNESENQILAVSILNSPDEKYLTYENFNVDSAIQFWGFGPLKNKEYSLKEPQLIFSLAHNHGPIWHMEWCPSGCYNQDRAGLLAVAGADAVVYIYSIPLFSQEETMGLYYKSKPVMKLFLQRPESSLLGGLKYYPSKISWSKASGHQYVCVGYTNGFLGLFNLKSKSVILKFKDPDDVPCILPLKCFQAHSHAITALTLYHFNGGCRWVMSGSYDRVINFWDLDNYNYPICSLKKNIITDGFWFTNWLCYVTASDEGSTTAHVTTFLKQVRDYMFDPNVPLTCSLSTISAVAGSDWLNGVIHANTMGEIVALFPRQILQFPEPQKVLKTKRLLFGYAHLIEKQKTPAQRVEDDAIRKKTLRNLASKKMSQGVKLSKIKSDFAYDDLFVNESVLYEQVEEKYALLFCDNKMQSYEDFPKMTAKQLTALSDAYGITQPNQYPLTTVNKIVFNPNRQASLYFATGYQAGFVRISWMEFLKNDHQVK